MHGLSPDEITALATLRESIEWDTVEAVINRQISRLERQLGDSSFQSLSEVTALQGERRGLRWFLALVERAYQDQMKE